MEENKNLKLEIEVLKKRVTALENKERRRKILGLIKLIIMVVLIAFVALKRDYTPKQTTVCRLW